MQFSTTNFISWEKEQLFSTNTLFTAQHKNNAGQLAGICPKHIYVTKENSLKQGQHANEQTNYIYCPHNTVIRMGFKDGNTFKEKSEGKHKPKQLPFLEGKLKTCQKM